MIVKGMQNKQNLQKLVKKNRENLLDPEKKSSKVPILWEGILQNFVAFSEYMNFT